MLKVLITAVIVAGLMVGCTLPALANSGEVITGNVTSPADAAKGDAVAEELEVLELLPVSLAGKPVSVDGGFRGVWGTDSATEAICPGVVAGVYGTVEGSDGTRSGFFAGLWQKNGRQAGGYLAGRYGDGNFSGSWRCLETGIGGPVRGEYAPSGDPANDVVRRFSGRWATEDGQQTGYLKGTWAPLVLSQVKGRFGGEWAHGPTVSAAEVAPDGRLWGTYGALTFADGSSISWFNGKADSNEGAQARLAGLVLPGKFYGLWMGANSNAHGYLKGVWAGHRFKGVWGHAGHSAQGQLWGRYGPFPTPEALEAQPLSTQKVTVQSSQSVRRQ